MKKCILHPAISLDNSILTRNCSLLLYFSTLLYVQVSLTEINVKFLQHLAASSKLAASCNFDDDSYIYKNIPKYTKTSNLSRNGSARNKSHAINSKEDFGLQYLPREGSKNPTPYRFVVNSSQFKLNPI